MSADVRASKPSGKFNVWSDTLNEQNFNENLTKFDLISVEEKAICQRDVESYPLDVAATTTAVGNDKKPVNISKPVAALNSRQRKKKRKRQNLEQLKNRLGPPRSNQHAESKSAAQIKVTELDAEQTVAKEIARYLKEPKMEVIETCVRVLGKKKALELLYETEDIQQKGGMLTQNGDRKRTSGGVYFQLIKNDESILNCQRSQIFVVDVEKKKKQKSLKRLRKKPKKLAEAKNKQLAEAAKQQEKKKETTATEREEEKTANDAMVEINESEMIYFDDE